MKKLPEEKKAFYFEAIGRRKSAVARVRLFEGLGSGIKVNNKDFQDYFPLEEMREIVKSPLLTTGTEKSFLIKVRVLGGGIRGQAEAIRLGISRALLKYKEELKPILKQFGFLRRDARVKERRKFGLKKARKAPQWSKR